jgi:LysR family transcriptional regulator for bpeEF and oprC
MKDLNSLKVFVLVAQYSSFKEAAANLGLTPSAVSKAITRLETELGVVLLQRTTRSVGLTDEGQLFYKNCKQILGEIDQAENLLSRATSGPHGRLRIHMTEGFGRRVVMPMLNRFLQNYPMLTVSTEMSDRVVDMANEGFDIDIRIGDVADGRVVARRLGQVKFVICASPEYLKNFGTPHHPGDLDNHNCLAYSHIHTGRLREWRFIDGGKEITKTVSGSLQANNAEALLVAAISGLGIVNVSHFIAHEAIAAGSVVPILQTFSAPGPDVHIVYLKSSSVPQKVRAFVDFLMQGVTGFTGTKNTTHPRTNAIRVDTQKNL